MRALLIDAAKREIREVEYVQSKVDDGGPGMSLQDHIGGYIETAFAWENGDVLFVDEEGLFKPQMHFFRIGERPDQPFAGHGIVVGAERYDGEGEYLGTNDPTITAAALRATVEFRSRDQVDAWAKGNASDVAGAIYTIANDGSIDMTVLAHVGELYEQMPKAVYPVCDVTMDAIVIGQALNEHEAIAVLRHHFTIAYPEQAELVAFLVGHARVQNCLLKDRSVIRAWIGCE
jgi:hypothetical protein